MQDLQGAEKARSSRLHCGREMPNTNRDLLHLSLPQIQETFECLGQKPPKATGLTLPTSGLWTSSVPSHRLLGLWQAGEEVSLNEPSCISWPTFLEVTSDLGSPAKGVLKGLFFRCLTPGTSVVQKIYLFFWFAGPWEKKME